MFLRNCWYVAGWSNDYKAELKSQKILGENIVFYRKRNGDAVALEDACPHRKLPLSQGQLREDRVICGYHGLTFNCSGDRVDAPTTGKFPNARLSNPTQWSTVTDFFGYGWVIRQRLIPMISSR